MKHCETLRQPCPNDPVCQGCDALDQRNSDGSCAGIDMSPSWRDWLSMANIVAMVLLMLFAGWLSQTPVVMAWMKGLM